MNEFLAKVENYLFDILGLALPGLLFLLILILPTYCIDFPKMQQVNNVDSYTLTLLSAISDFHKKLWLINTNMAVTIILILSYLVGHIVKVFSIIEYDLMKAIFDKGLNKVFVILFEYLKLIANSISKLFTKKEIYSFGFYNNYLKEWCVPIKKLLQYIFIFDPPDYDTLYDSLYVNCSDKLTKEPSNIFPKKWHPFYKISTIIHSQENIKSIAFTFLAKYNLYRSLSFIFIFSLIYFYSIFWLNSIFVIPTFFKIKTLILILSAIFWFTFHYKFKRYWTLCGNETLVSIFYYFNKNKLNAS